MVKPADSKDSSGYSSSIYGDRRGPLGGSTVTEAPPFEEEPQFPSAASSYPSSTKSKPPAKLLGGERRVPVHPDSGIAPANNKPAAPAEPVFAYYPSGSTDEGKPATFEPIKDTTKSLFDEEEPG